MENISSLILLAVNIVDVAVGALGSPAQLPEVSSIEPECATLDLACDNLWTSVQCQTTRVSYSRQTIRFFSLPRMIFRFFLEKVINSHSHSFFGRNE